VKLLYNDPRRNIYEQKTEKESCTGIQGKGCIGVSER
jgi:hypothetical protein